MTLKIQIALEFMILFSFLMVIFLFIFVLIATQRASISNQQTYAQLQTIAQNIAQQINFAQISGSGYTYNTSLYSTVGVPIYNISITKSGIIIVDSKINTQVISGIAYSNSNNIYTPTYLSNNTLFIQNYLGEICIDSPCYQINNIPSQISTFSYTSESNGKLGYIVNVQAKNTSGQVSNNALIGFSTTLGNFSKYSFSKNLTNIYGSANVFISRTEDSGIALVKATGFEGGNGLIENLSQWFPLNLDSGNSIYDLSGNNITASLTNTSWAFPNYVATFGGNSYLKLPSITLPSSFSIGLWVYPFQNNQETLFGQNSSSSGSFSVSLTNNTHQNSFMLNIQGYGNVLFGSYIPNQWSFIGITYDGSTKNISTYQNGVLLTSNILSTPLLTTSPFYLGYSNPLSILNPYTGSLSNFQVYANTFNPQQMFQLTTLGIETPPIVSGNSIIWMPMDGDLNNYAGSNYNIFTSGSVAFSQPNLYTKSNINQSEILYGSFNGINSAINLTNPSLGLLNSGVYKPLSVSLWFNLTSAQSIQELLSTYSSSSFCGFNIYLQNSNTITFSNNCGFSYSFFQPLFPNKWYNLVIVYNSSDLLNTLFYLNGVLIQTADIPLSSTTGWRKLLLGNYPGNYLNGDLSNIEIYNTTLSSSLVSEIYRNGMSLIPIYNNLTAWFPLDGSPSDYSFNGTTIASNVLYKNLIFKPASDSYSLNGYGLLFNGNGAAVGTQNTIINANQFTINDWIYAYPNSHIVSTISNFLSPTDSFGLTLNKQTTSINFELNLSIIANGEITSDLGGQIPPYVWTQVTGVYNDKNLTTYINGQEASVLKNVNIQTSNTITSFNIGGQNVNNYGSAYIGVISDQSLYKTPLNATQIYLLYRLGMPKSSIQNIPLS
ncbi:MAG: LamG-like jellyroll fold domain-containing protein [Candidatus Micrarchaeaceae archaeon]